MSNTVRKACLSGFIANEAHGSFMLLKKGAGGIKFCSIQRCG